MQMSKAMFCLEGRYVLLESCQHPGQRIGILPDGSTKKAFSTGTGQHGRFIPIVQQYVSLNTVIWETFIVKNFL